MLNFYCTVGSEKSSLKYDLKEQCHEIFRVRFFLKTTSPGPNRHAQEWFRIFSNIRGVIRILNRLPGDEFTGESIGIH